MAIQRDDPKGEVNALELALSASYQLEALIRLLERKGLLSRTEVLSELSQIIQEQHQKPN